MALSSSSNANTIPENEKSRLKVAVESGNPSLVQDLIERNNSSNAWRDFYRDLLACANSERVAELLVTHGADVNARRNEETTALMDASQVPVIKYLIENTNIELETTDDEGRTALRRAVQLDNDPGKALYLIEHTQVNINAADIDGRSILMTAVWKNQIEVLDRLLLNPGLNPDQQDEKGRIALHHLADDNTHNYGYQDHPAPHDQQKTDEYILDKLLNAGNRVGSKDYKGLTCLHWAAFKGCSGLLEVFLRSRNIDVNVDEENDRGWTPLHNACEAAGDMLDSVNVLLHHGANFNKKTRNGRTPLHLAAGAGNLEIVQRLLSLKEIKRNARDMFGNTALLSAASLNASHPNRNAIVRLFSPWRKVHTLSVKCETAAKRWNATIVDFESKKDDEHAADGPSSKDQENTGHPRPKEPEKHRHAVGAKPLPQTSVFELLYGRDPNDDEKPAQKVSPSDLGRDGFRWIHLPANETSWCQDLLSKYYVEKGTMDLNSFKALERSFNHQRGGHESYSRYMSSTCQPVLQPWGNEQGGLTRGDTADGLLSPRASMSVPKREASSGSEDQPGSQSEQRKSVSFLGKERTVESPRSSYDDDGSPMKRQRQPDDAFISDFYIFMPYLHFETADNYQEMCKFRKHFAGKKTLANHQIIRGGPDERDIALYEAHLNSPEHSLHIRRTLDQSFYRHINTDARDRDQVIHRFQKSLPEEPSDPKHDDSKILMVDQLWMWVIGPKLIVTCFSPRWAQPKKDPLDLLEYINSLIELGSREPVRSVWELAMIITGRCYGAYDRHGVGSEEQHFLDMFEGWIGFAMNDEVEVFEYFKQDSAKASEWLRNPHDLRTVKRREERRRKKANSKDTTRKPNFKVIPTLGSKYASTDESFVENLLDVGWETTLLKEVKDIRDELGMLAMIFERQEYVRQCIKDTIDTISNEKKWSDAAKAKFARAFEDHRRTIAQPKKDTERMNSQATGVYNSVRDLLDLKQKHANAIEARYAREQTDDSSRQGKTLTVFTTVTTIFLPISFIAAFFAVNIGNFPHDDKGTQVLSLGFVLKYIFGAGLSIALVCVVLALKVEELWHWIRDKLDGDESGLSSKTSRSESRAAETRATKISGVATLTPKFLRARHRRREDEESGAKANGVLR